MLKLLTEAMEIIHINSYLCGTSLYYNLFHSLEKLGISQRVIVPLKKNANWTWNPSVNLKDVHYFTQQYQTASDRLLYKRKIRKGLQRFAPAIYKVDHRSGAIHAHTLFSDGGLAYEFSKQTGLPYVVSVRNTDLNCFWKYMVHLRPYGRQILENASAIIFLSDAYRNQLKNLGSKWFWSRIESKCHTIPNGIQRHWFVECPSPAPDDGIRLLYVGRFDKNKNLGGIIKAVKSLKLKGFPITVRLVGAKGSYSDSIRSQYSHEWIEYINFTKDTAELKKHFAWANVFVMPSFTETFGLVYAEALSQGVPVIYTRGQGFDGWCPNATCGLGVNPRDISEIASAIATLARNHNSQSCIALAQRFCWGKIAGDYKRLYANILSPLA